MLLAVFSDIHSNHIALEAAMAEAERRGAEKWIFLGDYVSDCAFPERTMARIYEARETRDCVFLKGNREEYMLDYRLHGGNWRYGSTTGSLLYTYDHLTERDFRFFESRPITAVIDPNGRCPIRISHGSPWKSRENLRPGREALLRSVLARIPEKVVVSGHSHHPFTFAGNGRKYANTGSVGVPVSGVPGAEMLFLRENGDTWDFEPARVPYDVEAVVREIRESGLPEKAFVWADAIIKEQREARNYAIEMLQRAEALAGGGEVTNAHLLRAARELGITER